MLAAEAAIKGDPELAFAAIAMDPLTSAVLTMKEIRDMTAEMLEAQRAVAAAVRGKKIRPLGTISTRPGTKGVPVPLDRPWPSTAGSGSSQRADRGTRRPACILGGSGGSAAPFLFPCAAISSQCA